MHWEDVRFSCGGELRLSLLVSRKSFGSPGFIFLAIVFQLCNGNYKVYLTPIFGRVFKQEIFKSIAYGCRICGGTIDIKSGAGQVVLADLLPAAGASGRVRSDPDVLDAARAVEFGVGGALVGGGDFVCIAGLSILADSYRTELWQSR